MSGRTLRLADFVRADRMVVPLEAASLPPAAAVLLERLVSAGAVADAEKLRARVVEERPEDIVAMGDRAFLLHFRTDAVEDLAVGIGTSPTPICRQLGEGDTQCARILLVVVAPPKLAARYLQIVGAFARFLSAPERVDAVLAQPNAEALEVLPAFYEYELPEQLCVRDLMIERPRTVSPDATLREAAWGMVRLGVGGLPVVESDGRVVGMLSERDVLRYLLGRNVLQSGASGARPGVPPPESGAQTVRDAMTRQVLCVSPDQPLAEVASIMATKDVDRVPVVQEGRLVGFLTRGDIVRNLIGS